MTALSQALSAALLHFIWQGTAVAFLLSIAFALLRNRSANARYLASCAAMALMAALPVITLCVSYRAPVALSGAFALAIPAEAPSAAVASRDWLAALVSSARQWTLPLWIAGVAIFAIRLLIAWGHVARLRRTAEHAAGALAETAAQLAGRMQITRPVRVLMTTLADSPSVVGWIRPAILIPAATLAGLDAAQLEAILAHELAHIRRHDYLVNMLQTAVETLLFYHPAVWWVSSRMRHERELCCDDLAVCYSGDALGYARALTRLERARVVPGPAIAANSSPLLYRVQRLTGAVRGCAPSRLPALLAAIAAAVLIPAAMHRAHAQTPSVSNADQAPGTISVAGQLSRVEVVPDTMVGFAVISPDLDTAADSAPGSVLVEATLDAGGKVVDARVVTGPLEMRNQALRLVLDRRFANATDGEVRQVNVDFAPGRRPRIRDAGQDVPNVSQEQSTASKVDQERATTQFLREQLNGTLARLADVGNDQEAKTQLEASVAALHRQLEAAQQAVQLSLQQKDAMNHSLDDKAVELNRALERLAALEREISEKAGRLQDTAADQAPQAEIEAATALLQHLREMLQNASNTYGQNSPEIKGLRAQIAAVAATLMRLALPGKTVVRIDSDGGPLEFKLPVEIGSTLTESAMSQIRSSIPTGYDVRFVPLNDHEVEIRIVKR